MQATINKQYLRYAVSTVMFCQVCNHVLDVRKAVSFDLATPQGDLVLNKVTCASCFDHTVKSRLDSVVTKHNYTATVLDGRTMYGRRKA